MTPAGDEHDVVVVGGRIGGSLTAAYLAARGLTVLVLESRSFPSATMSTHFFRGDELVRGLADVGVLDEVLATGAPRFLNELFYVEDATEPTVEPPQEPGEAGFGLSVRRETLDAILARRVAALPGVTFRTDTKAVGLLHDSGRVSGVRDDAGAEHRATVVVGADGRRSGVAAGVSAGDVRRHAGCRVMYYRYVTGWVAPDGGRPEMPEFSLVGNALAYVFPSDHGTACVAVTVPADSGTSAGDYDSLIAAHPGLRGRAQRAEPIGRVVVGASRDNVVVDAAGPGWALVGDAGTYQDPWSGRGMDTAARQAAALAATLTDDPAGWNADYARARDGVTLERFDTTVRLAPDLRLMLAGDGEGD